MPNLYDVLLAHRDNKHDHKKFGLVLPGGGMRGVYSAGALAPLIEYGFRDAFEHIIGASAGAINGAYFLGNDVANGPITNTYTNDLTNKEFVNLLRRDKRVDVDYLVDTVLKQKRPIDYAALEQSHAKLHVIVTDAKTGKKVVLSNHHDLAYIYEEFRATAALPIVYDKPVQLGDRCYIDGVVSDALPIDVALNLGCTDIVVLLTQQISYYQDNSRHTRLVNHLIKKFATNHTAAVRKKLPTDQRLLQVNLRRLLRPHKKIRIYFLEPSNEEILISLYTTDKAKVKALAKLGVTDMDVFLHKALG